MEEIKNLLIYFLGILTMFVGAVIPVFPESGWVSFILMIFVSLPLFFIGLWLFTYGKFDFQFKGTTIKTFFLKNRKVFLLSIVLLVFIFFAWKYYTLSQREVTCLKLAEHRSRTGVYLVRYEGETYSFETQDEAVNYCVKVLRP